MTYGPDPRKNPEAKDVVAEFRAKKFEPEAYTLYSYAARADHQAGRRSGEIARPQEGRREDAFRHEVQHRDRRISYDKKGDITGLDYVMYIWKKDARRQDHLRGMPAPRTAREG